MQASQAADTQFIGIRFPGFCQNFSNRHFISRKAGSRAKGFKQWEKFNHDVLFFVQGVSVGEGAAVIVAVVVEVCCLVGVKVGDGLGVVVDVGGGISVAVFVGGGVLVAVELG
jgi:hypothetical protein